MNKDKNPLDKAIERINEIEPELRYLDTLFALGLVVTKGKSIHEAGDWDFHIWAHGLDGFSVGFIVRSRHDNNPFPAVTHTQKKWIVCSKGVIEIETQDGKTILTKGRRMTINPMMSHTIFPITDECAAVLVTVPADPAMQ